MDIINSVVDGVVKAGVVVGNTAGSFIDWTCPKCGQKSKIAQYGGNLKDGGICPKCRQNINS